jgi:hypothetical protein
MIVPVLEWKNELRTEKRPLRGELPGGEYKGYRKQHV